jgi:putative CocE/NonD family hydrolase
MEEQSRRFGRCHLPRPQYEGLTTQSLFLTMRDGVRLAVELVLPKDLPSGTRIPALLSQTRYWRALELRAPFSWFLKPWEMNRHFKGFWPFFTSHGYALVLVDVRGTGASFGTWPYPWDEASVEDAAEIVDWIVAQPWSNGRVGGYGISYVGTTAELLAATGHSAVRAAIPMFNHPDAYTDIAMPGGVLNQRFLRDWSHFDATLDRNMLPEEYGFLARLIIKGVKPVDADRRLLQEAVSGHAVNGNVSSLAQGVSFRDERPEGLTVSADEMTVKRFTHQIDKSGVATFGWGSWMDAGTADAVLRRFMTFDTAQRAVIGAWEHGGRFHASPYQPANLVADPPLPDQWAEMVRFFDMHLKDADNGVRPEKLLFYYTMGEERWKKSAVWPPRGTVTRRWYLGEENGLSQQEPAAETGVDRYAVDFEASTGDHNRWWEMGGIWDHSVIYGDRADETERLLTYTTEPLVEDMEITGYPVVTLYVASTEPDGVIIVYLEDVDENGRITYVTEGQLRVIHRQVSSEPSPYQTLVPYHTFKEADAMPLAPGEVAEITFGLQPTSVLIKKGHRIRIAIAGHDAGTFVRIPAEGVPILTVQRNSVYPSNIDLPIARKRE